MTFNTYDIRATGCSLSYTRNMLTRLREGGVKFKDKMITTMQNNAYGFKSKRTCPIRYFDMESAIAFYHVMLEEDKRGFVQKSTLKKLNILNKIKESR